MGRDAVGSVGTAAKHDVGECSLEVLRLDFERVVLWGRERNGKVHGEHLKDWLHDIIRGGSGRKAQQRPRGLQRDEEASRILLSFHCSAEGQAHRLHLLLQQGPKHGARGAEERREDAISPLADHLRERGQVYRLGQVPSQGRHGVLDRARMVLKLRTLRNRARVVLNERFQAQESVRERRIVLQASLRVPW
eukprot:scaffold529_cov308-Pinguiococcus_pyrenoidosus.AAC.82